jgi:hypothetical protein
MMPSILTRLPIVVTLTPPEIRAWGSVGFERQYLSVCRGTPDKHGYDGDGWDIHIEAACAECAVSKALGRYVSPTIDTFKKGGDIGPHQVRRRSRADYELLVRPDDVAKYSPDTIFILVTGRCPTYTIVGWMRLCNTQQREMKSYGGRPLAWFVPQKELHTTVYELLRGVW